MKRVPLKFLWWPLAKLQEGLGGKARFYTIGGAALLAILIVLMILVPSPLADGREGTASSRPRTRTSSPRGKANSSASS